MTKQEKMDHFDPDGPASGSGLFGLPFNYEESETVVLPVPWEATVSYGSGTAGAPRAIQQASGQVDLFDPYLPEGWKKGIWLAPPPPDLEEQSQKCRRKAEKYLQALAQGEKSASWQKKLDKINTACRQMVEQVEAQATRYLKDGKRVILLGGDHSTPLGYLRALSQVHPAFGILQIDAHADLRVAYEGFHYSHASIMHNAMKLKAVEKLVQVGVRDYGHAEHETITNSHGRIATFFDHDLKAEAYRGKSWDEHCQDIIDSLPRLVYLSIDIDGLEPHLCPHTGTPVPGGLSAGQLYYLLEKLVDSGRQIIGADLCEVSPGADEWDANVGARILYKLAHYIAASY